MVVLLEERWREERQEDWVWCKGAAKRDCEVRRARAGVRVGAKCNEEGGRRSGNSVLGKERG
eukprot:3762679-Rhodomonas_salina.2